MATNYRPQYQRRLGNKRVEIQPRDIELFETIYRFRFVKPSHLIALHDISYKKLVDRIKWLYHDGYLEREILSLPAIGKYRPGGGRDPQVISLKRKGARALSAWNGCDYTATSMKMPDQIEHELLIADYITAIEKACRDRDDLAFVDRRVERWKVDTRYNGKEVSLGVEPDYFFGIRDRRKPKERQMVWFFLEADRGTMDIKREDAYRTSLHRKNVAYFATHTQGLHKELFGIGNFRVLYLTAGKEGRVANMAKGARDKEAGGDTKRLFLFGSKDAFLNTDDPLAFPWKCSVDDTPVHIVID